MEIKRKPPGGPHPDAGGRPSKGAAGSSRTPEQEREELDFDSGMAPGVGLIPRTRPRQSAPSPDETESHPRSSSKAPLRRKEGTSARSFTRLVTRPQTTLAADAAVDGLPSEQTISVGDDSAPQFGKIRPDFQTPGYRPNRIVGVLDDIWIYSPMRWLEDRNLKAAVLTGVAILLAAGIGVLSWKFGREALRGMFDGPPVVDTAGSEAELAARMDRAHKAVDAFLAPGQWTGKLAWVLERERVMPRMEAYYGTQGLTDPDVSGFTIEPPIRAGAESWFTVVFQNAAGGESRVLMKETPEGGLLDWENFVAYGSMPWKEFCESRPVAAQSLRVRIRRAENGPGPFSDPEEFAAYEIEHRSGAPVLKGHVPRTARVQQALGAMITNDEWYPVNLYLRFEPGANGTDCVISDLIRTNWLDEVPTVR